MELTKKTILLISPQPWRDLYISKHHYAIELSKQGNKVFFLEPPKASNSTSVEIQESGIENLSILKYKTFFPLNLRFHMRGLYNFLMRLQAKKIKKSIGEFIDIVWCFEPNLFANLNWFDGKTNIYHPVDLITQPHQLNVVKSADYLFSVANNILELFKPYAVPRTMINHGLSNYFIQNKPKEWKLGDKLHFAYMGNLLIKGMDRRSLKEIIQSHSNIDFDFYGLYEDERYANPEANQFIEFLLAQNNVKLHGLVHPKQLSETLNQYDGFLICYDPTVEFNSGTNCHKVLEYLSYGRLVVSSKLSEYRNHQDLLAMSKEQDNTDYVEIFNASVEKIAALNEKEIMERRRAFALNNSYQKQIERIANFINSH